MNEGPSADRSDSQPPPLHELPPVEPPSARFVMQLFVIPFLVVVVLVCLLLLVYGLFGRLATSSDDLREYVQTIRSGNENRRWRAAYELASLLYNEPKLRADRSLQAELARLLDDELDKPAAKRKDEVPQYLALALGAFDSLEPAASGKQGQGQEVDPLASLLRALGPNAPPAVRSAAAQSLSRQAAHTDGHPPEPARVVPVLREATSADDPEVRQNAAYALGYFDTPESRSALHERLGDAHPLVRFNVAAALTRLDDPAALDVLREMLSPRDLEGEFSEQRKERPTATQSMIESIQLEAIRTLSEAVDAGHSRIASTVRPDLEKLAARGPRNIQVEARSLLNKIPEAGGSPATR